jgi:acyl-CoA synthetase (AMP-forming)/AMP-acid ligase II
VFLDSGTSGQDSTALVLADGSEFSYRKLGQLSNAAAREFGGPKRLVTVFGGRDLATVVAYLGALAGHHVCAMLDRATPADRQQDHFERYQPDFVAYGPGDAPAAAAQSTTYERAGTAAGGAALFRRAGGAGRSEVSGSEISEDTALLLFTSGSTGSAQAVRLSRSNLTANAAAIATSLGIQPDDRGITSLPLYYCYGLSVLNSHLSAGASVVLSEHSPVSARFWRLASTAGCTSLAGVPTVYRLLQRSGLDPGAVPSLRLLTQAGARLEPDLVRHFAAAMDRVGGRFIVMYGQTEATSRISWLPHELLTDHLGSVGHPVPGGRVWIAGDHPGEPEAALPDGVTGRVMYAGPNVMLGYARSRADLAAGDTMHGVLDTGDRGYLRDGLLYLTGRAARIVKILGRRVDLDDVETIVRRVGPAAVVGTPDERIMVFVESDQALYQPVREWLARELRVPANLIQFIRVGALPVTPRGKMDYAALRCQVEDDSCLPSPNG